MRTSGITVIDKLMMLVLTCLAVIVSVMALTSYLPHVDHVRLEEEVRKGRSVLADIDRLQPYTTQPPYDDLICDLPVRKTKAVLALYASDLAARRHGVRSLDETGSFSVQVFRANAMRRVRDVLVCAPLDGDMWYRLSLVSFILNMDRATTETYLAWSERTAPQELWIKTDRDWFARRYLGGSEPTSTLR